MFTVHTPNKSHSSGFLLALLTSTTLQPQCQQQTINVIILVMGRSQNIHADTSTRRCRDHGGRGWAFLIKNSNSVRNKLLIYAHLGSHKIKCAQ